MAEALLANRTTLGQPVRAERPPVVDSNHEQCDSERTVNDGSGDMRKTKTVAIPTDVRRRVEKRAAECLKLAEAHFKREYQPVSISYTLRGTTAGTFQPGTRNVNFNSILLMENIDDFIYRTVAHEVAHYVHNINTKDLEGGTEYFGHYMRTGRRMKRDIHGTDWQRIMVLFGAPVSRTHSYDVTNAAVRTKRTYAVKCSGCGEQIMVTKNKFDTIARGTHMWIRGHQSCGRLVPVNQPTQPLPPVKPEIDPNDPWIDPFKRPVWKPRAIAPAPAHIAALQNKAKSKLDHCKELYKKYHSCSRQRMISEFVLQANCTPAGAATYYATCKALYG